MFEPQSPYAPQPLTPRRAQAARETFQHYTAAQRAWPSRLANWWPVVLVLAFVALVALGSLGARFTVLVGLIPLGVIVLIVAGFAWQSRRQDGVAQAPFLHGASWLDLADVYQDRAHQAGPLARAYAPSHDAQAWASECEVARSHRAWLANQQRTSALMYIYMVVVMILGVGAPLFMVLLGRSAELSLVSLVVPLWLGAHLISRVRIKRTVDTFALTLVGGCSFASSEATIAELTWLDQHRWGFTVFVQDTEGFGSRHVVTGRLGNYPVMITVAHRAGGDDSVSDARRLTSLYVAYPTEHPYMPPPHIQTEIAQAGFAMHVRRDGIRLSKNGSSVATVESAIALARALTGVPSLIR